MVVRVVNAVLLFACGALYGVVATFAHHAMITIGTARLPWGLAVGLLGTACLTIGVRLVGEGRSGALATALGIIAVIAVLSLKGPGGSIVIADDLPGIVWSIAPAVICALVVLWPQGHRRGRNAERA